MECKEMEEILERYWNGETTLEEEARLRAWMAGGEISEEARRYQSWFAGIKSDKQLHLPDDFDARMLAAFEERPVVKAQRITLLHRFKPLLRAAAVVACVITWGHWAQHPFFGEEAVDMLSVDTIGQQITAPSVALSGDATFKREKQLIDSLQRAVRQQKK